MPTFTLNYFDCRGRGECIRMLCAVANIPLTDKRISKIDWPTLKTNFPTEQIPCLEIANTTTVCIPQTRAILTYLANEAKLNGKTNLEQAQITAILDTVQDIMNVYVTNVLHVSEEERKNALQVFCKENATKSLMCLEKLVKLTCKKSGIAVGDCLTVADIVIFDLCTCQPEIQTIVECCPVLKEIMNTVCRNPRVTTYLQTRPQTCW